MRGHAGAGGARSGGVALCLALLAWLHPLAASAQDEAPLRLSAGRITIAAYPRDETLARSLLAASSARDTFPGLPRPRERVLIAIAPDAEKFREWIGPYAPEWGAAIAFPEQRRIILQGSAAPSSAGDPMRVARHELAHLALHEALGNRPPRWFDEGYASFAAGEWGRDEVLATSFALLVRGLPTLDSLDRWFAGGSSQAGAAYALAYRAVSDLAALDPERGLTLLFEYWERHGSLDRAVREAYGVTLDGFDAQWRKRTMRRYGALALFADLTLALGLLTLLILPLYIARRRRDRRRFAALVAADEAADRAARESALEELLKSAGSGTRDAGPGTLDREPSPDAPNSPPVDPGDERGPHGA
ncbi:MAG TPA: hypothetical protein VK922_17475 [Gemmatimonadaceae bacterium]|nr:hypothetical protein [Gemmatimonadaceae bacterium]